MNTRPPDQQRAKTTAIVKNDGPVLCNMITGFLGSGKTTVILSLLKHKPAGERWAILVNEFGEVGIDGSVMQASVDGQDDSGAIVIREIPGGCMCCTAGVPMRVALTQLLKDKSLTRLLIESSGLGHPKEALTQLREFEAQNALRLKASLTVVDAKKLKDPRYTRHETFIAQLEVADVIVANKADRYDESDVDALNTLAIAMTKANPSSAPVIERLSEPRPEARLMVHARFGNIDASLLDRDCRYQSHLTHTRSHRGMHENRQKVLSKSGQEDYSRAEGFPDGFYTVGWLFHADKRFDGEACYNWFVALDCERAKALIITSSGLISLNKTGAVITQTSVTEKNVPGMQSRIEIISDHPIDASALERNFSALFQTNQAPKERLQH